MLYVLRGRFSQICSILRPHLIKEHGYEMLLIAINSCFIIFMFKSTPVTRMIVEMEKHVYLYLKYRI